MPHNRFKIIFEDNFIIIVDKPPGLLVIPTPKKETNTLTTLLNRELDNRKLEVNAYPCHRLDRETSGLIIYAKGKRNQKVVMDVFKTKMIKKIYIAFVHGIVKKSFDIVKRPVYNRNKKRFEEALTKYGVSERRNNFSVVEIEPVTGKTNQIRIHMKEIGHPLVGESVYAFRKDFKLKFKRAALHAGYISFVHPFAKDRMEFKSSLPEDMKRFLENNK